MTYAVVGLLIYTENGSSPKFAIDIDSIHDDADKAEEARDEKEWYEDTDEKIWTVYTVVDRS